MRLKVQFLNPFNHTFWCSQTISCEKSEAAVRLESILGFCKVLFHLRYRRNGVASLLLKTFIEHLKLEQNSRIKAMLVQSLFLIIFHYFYNFFHFSYLHVLTSNKEAIYFYERFKLVWLKKQIIKQLILNLVITASSYTVFFRTIIQLKVWLGMFFNSPQEFKLHTFSNFGLFWVLKGRAKDGYCYVLYTNGGKMPQNSLFCFVDNVRSFCQNIFNFKITWLRNILNWMDYGWLHNKIHYFRQ